MVLMGLDIPASAVKRQLASGIDLMIHLGRLRDKRRVLLEITEIAGCEKDEILLNPIYVFQETGTERNEKVIGDWIKVGELIHWEKMRMAGF
jgi:pilus assembly protein CpaF